MLIVSPQGLEADGFRYQNVYQSGYFVGRLDYNKPELKHGDFTELDQGFDFTRRKHLKMIREADFVCMDGCA